MFEAILSEGHDVGKSLLLAEHYSTGHAREGGRERMATVPFLSVSLV